MPDNDNGSGAVVAEIAASMDLAKALTLFQIEESLVLLAESAEEEGLTPEIEQAMTVYLAGRWKNAIAWPTSFTSAKEWPSWPRPKGRGCKLGRSISKQQRSALAPWCSVFWTTSE